MRKDKSQKPESEEVSVAILSGKVGFLKRKIARDKKEHYIVIKRSIHQEDVIILNLYAPYNNFQNT